MFKRFCIEMNVKELLQKLVKLRRNGKIDEAIELLVENTGKDKLVDPSNTSQLETAWSRFANPLFLQGRMDDFFKVCERMYEHTVKLQRQGNPRIHKGWSLYGKGNVHFQKALNYFMLSFIEDTIDNNGFPENSLSTHTLYTISKVDSDFLRNLSKMVIEKSRNHLEPDKVLTELNITKVPYLLWTLEVQMEKIEAKLRKFIEKNLQKASKEWQEELIPKELQDKINDRIMESSRVLWFSEQPTSPLLYLTFPSEYIILITDDNCWTTFKAAFEHKEVLKGRLKGLAQIRHKIAHYRKISPIEREMFEQAIQWLENCMTKLDGTTTSTVVKSASNETAFTPPPLPPEVRDESYS